MFGNFEKGSALTYWVATFLVEFKYSSTLLNDFKFSKLKQLFQDFKT